MTFDALSLACIRDELERSLVPGRVQQVLLPGPHSVGLEVYTHQQRAQLLLQADPDDPRVHLASGKLRRGVESDSPLLLLLRKYTRDALLVGVRQPDPAERVLELHFEHREHGSSTLVVELLGRATNLILRRGGSESPGGTILDCLLRIPPGERVRRVLLPGRPYELPPAVTKLPPLDDGTPGYYERLAALCTADGPLWKALVAQVAGVSPAQARELALRAAGDVEAPAREAPLLAVAHALQELWSPVRTGQWQPGVWREGDRITGYSPYAARSAAEFAPMPSLSAAIEEWAAGRAAAHARPTAAPEQGRDSYAALREAVAGLIARARSRIDRQLDALARDEPAPGAAETLRSHAGWLLALAGRVGPGDQELVVPAEETGGESIVIPLDSNRSPIEQAESWFQRAARMDRAAAFIPQRRAHLEGDRAYLDDLQGDLALAQSQPEIAAVEQALYEARLLQLPAGRKSARAPKAGGPRRFALPSGIVILAGRNAGQNDRLTFETARPGDLWLHVRGAPGSHVIVQASGKEVGAEIVLMAAQVAGYFSSLRDETAVDVIVADRRSVSRLPGGRPGQVIVRGERTVRVPAQLPEGLKEG